MGIVFGLLVVVALGALLAYAATRPDTFSLSRSIAINAPAARIFPLIADFHEWTRWSPWEKMDPAMKKIARGPANERGSHTLAWRMTQPDTTPVGAVGGREG